MTREETIMIMRNERPHCGEKMTFTEEEKCDAYDMAIEALQAEGGDAEMNEVKSPYMQHSPNGATHGRLIDADALKGYLLSLTEPKQDSFGDWGALVTIRIDKLAEIIDNAPTVQADRPHGEWIEREDWNGDSYYDCSVCGESFVLYDGTPSMNLYHFCPNCGADMRKETK